MACRAKAEGPYGFSLELSLITFPAGSTSNAASASLMGAAINLETYAVDNVNPEVTVNADLNQDLLLIDFFIKSF